eukprot:m.72864 g.72864  ORF g.72864 m.72864 type:complete len:572 (-) comp8402_c0_seq2:2600-4315(-)
MMDDCDFENEVQDVVGVREKVSFVSKEGEYVLDMLQDLSVYLERSAMRGLRRKDIDNLILLQRPKLSMCVCPVIVNDESRKQIRESTTGSFEGDEYNSKPTFSDNPNKFYCNSALECETNQTSSAVYFLLANYMDSLFIARDFNLQNKIACDDKGRYEPTCHDINSLSRSGESALVACGMSSGRVLLYDCITKHWRIFGDGAPINETPVKAIRWQPGKEDIFLVGHEDGSLYVINTALSKVEPIESTKMDEQETNNLFVKMQPESESDEVNPRVSVQIRNSGGVTGLEFSKDCSMVAITYQKGLLVVFNVDTWVCIFASRSFYGAFTCLSWSADCRYIVTGSEDDMVTWWNIEDKKLITRGIGHTSFISAVAFDEHLNDIRKGKVYRVISTGDDGMLLFWDFDPQALPQLPMRRTSHIITNPDGGYPKNVEKKHHHSMSLQFWKRKKHGHKKSTSTTLPDALGECVIVLPPSLYSQTPQLEPICKAIVHKDPISDILVRKEGIYTIDSECIIRLWLHPPQRALRMLSPILCTQLSTEQGNDHDRNAISQSDNDDDDGQEEGNDNHSQVTCV